MTDKKPRKTVAKKTPGKRGRPKKKVNKKTYIALVIDRSGSMSSIQQAAFSGINEQIETIKKNAAKGGETFVTYIQFDDVIETMFSKRKAEELKAITSDQYQPRGMTAMRDAIWKAILDLRLDTEPTDDTGYLVVVISDGYENASREVTQSQLNDEIKRLEDTGKWTFTYLMSNVEIKHVMTTFGAQIGNIATFDSSNNLNASVGFAVSSNAISGYMQTRGKGQTKMANFYVSPDPNKKDEDTK